MLKFDIQMSSSLCKKRLALSSRVNATKKAISIISIKHSISAIIPISLEINNTVAVDRESILDIFSIQFKRFDGDDAYVVMEIGTLN